MSTATLILGESGTGKSSSMRNLQAADTLLIQSVKKPLPFKSADWRQRSESAPAGNIFVTDNSDKIIGLMTKTRKPIIILDDFQYVLANEFMRRSDEKGYGKFTEIGRHAWEILSTASTLPEHVRVYILWHTHNDESGTVRAKTIGKLLDEKITVEGLFSIVLRTAVRDEHYSLSTKNNGADTVKSPIGMFDDDFIDNDLAKIDAAICSYYELTNAA